MENQDGYTLDHLVKPPQEVRGLPTMNDRELRALQKKSDGFRPDSSWPVKQFPAPVREPSAIAKAINGLEEKTQTAITVTELKMAEKRVSRKQLQAEQMALKKQAQLAREWEAVAKTRLKNQKRLRAARLRREFLQDIILRITPRNLFHERPMLAKSAAISLSVLVLGGAAMGALNLLAHSAAPEARHQATVEDLSADALLAQADEANRYGNILMAEDEAAYAMAGVVVPAAAEGEKPALPEHMKADPFAPMVLPGMGSGGGGIVNPGTSDYGAIEAEKPRDVLESVRFTGLIGSSTSKEKVAIFHINDPEAGTYTEVKRVGESFSLLDKKMVVKQVGSNEVRLSLNGKTRSLWMTPYEDIPMAQQGSKKSVRSVQTVPPSSESSGRKSIIQLPGMGSGTSAIEALGKTLSTNGEKADLSGIQGL